MLNKMEQVIIWNENKIVARGEEDHTKIEVNFGDSHWKKIENLVFLV